MTANESVEERSHVFQDTEVTSQCGVSGLLHSLLFVLCFVYNK